MSRTRSTRFSRATPATKRSTSSCSTFSSAPTPKTAPLPNWRAPSPRLQNGGISRDGLTVTYHLRHGVRWHDGQPFTAHDVAFSYAAVENPRNNVVGRSNFDAVASVTTPDPYTVVVHLKHRSAPIVSDFFGDSDQPIHVVPAHLLESLPDLNEAPFNAAPVGTGPFKFVRWDRGNRIVLEANDDYFMGKPNLRRIELLDVPDVTTLANQIRTHEVDLGAVDPATYHAMLDVPDVARALFPLNGYVSYGFNLGRPPLGDLRIRQAIAYAIDKATIVEKNTFALAVVATADLPPESWAHDPNVPVYPYDVAKARALLDAAGWRTGPDGMRRRDGAPLVVELAESQGSVTGHNEDVQVQSMLRAVGIDLEIRPYQPTLLSAPAEAGGIIMKGAFDMVNYSWIAGADPDNSSQFTCSAQPPTNLWRYCNAEVDAAERAQLDSYDVSARKRAFAIVERHVAADLPALWLYWPRRRYLMNPDFHGFNPNCCGPAWNAYRWTI